MLTLFPDLKAKFSTPLKIGSVEIQSRVLQSPLLGVIDLIFRRLGLFQDKGNRGVCQSRKQLAWYRQDFVGASAGRDKLSRIESLEERCELIEQAIACYIQHGNST